MKSLYKRIYKSDKKHIKNRSIIDDLYIYATPEELIWLTTPIRDIYRYIEERRQQDELQTTEITTQSRAEKN